jgi:hypothetical protein
MCGRPDNMSYGRNETRKNGMPALWGCNKESEKGFRMQKGILFSFLVLMLLMNLAALDKLFANGNDADSFFTKISALNSVGNKTANLDESVAILYDQTGNYFGKQRHLPFSFSADKNIVVFSQTLPEKQSVIDVFYDSINAFAILAKNSSTYDGLRTDANTLSNSKWGGTSRKITVSMLPQCFGYSIDDTNAIEVGGSCGPFDFNSLKRIDVNVLVSDSEDFNSVSCTFGASSACPSTSFDASNNNAYFSLQIMDANCTACAIPQSSKTVYGYFNPALNNSMTISCVSTEGACTSGPIEISLSNKLTISHNETSNDLLIGLDFNSEIESIVFSDFNSISTSLVYGASVKNK